jgi:hypothetical protein
MLAGDALVANDLHGKSWTAQMAVEGSIDEFWYKKIKDVESFPSISNDCC